MAPRHFDQIEVAFEIIVPGYQVPYFTADCRFQNFIVIRITAYLQFPRRRHDTRASRDEPHKHFSVALRILKSPNQSWTVKNLRQLQELRE